MKKNLFILAAGTGSRLYPLTRHTPKSLLDLGDGSTLLGQQVDGAVESGVVEKIYVVTGYCSKQIEAKAAEWSKRIPIETIFNPFFDTTNAIVSVWCAIQKMVEKDFVLTNGDNLFRKQVLPELAGRGDGVHLTTSLKDAYDEDDMKVLRGAGGLLERVSKDEGARVDAESVGLVGVHGERFRRAFHDTVVEMLANKDNLHVFWHQIFNHLVERGIEVRTHDIPRDAWAEVDFHADMDTIKKEIAAKLRAAKLR